MRLPPVRAALAALGWQSWWLCPASSCDAALDPAPGRAADLEVTAGTKGQDGGCREEGPGSDAVPQKDPQGWGHCCPPPGGHQLVACRVDSATPPPQVGPLSRASAPRGSLVVSYGVHPDLSPCRAREVDWDP